MAGTNMTIPVNPTYRRWANLSKAADHAGYTRRTIERWIREGRLPSYKVGRAIRVDLNELDQFIESNAA